MKKYITLFLCLPLMSEISNAQTTLSKTIISSGLTREYRIYIPAIYNASTPVPLVFNFHGYTSTNTQQEFYADFRPIADTANFILVHPQGLVIGGSTGWNNFAAIGSSPYDIDFISNLIDTIKSQYNINLNKVYSTGFSNGGFMSYDLACLLSSRFTAIASVSGSMVTSHINACNPSHPLPVMQLHGTADATVSYNGTGGIVASEDIDSLVNYWVQKNNCNTSPVFTTLPNVVTTDNCTVEHYLYNGGTNGSTVEFYKIINGGHTWPGALFSIPGANTNKDMNACKEIWRFFNQYSLDNLGSPASVNAIESKSLSCYPNPCTGTVMINTIECLQNASISIQNMTGEFLFHKEHINTHQFILDLSEYASGIYFVVLKEKESIRRAKIVKN